MPIFALFVGVLLIGAGINDKLPDLMELLKDDFSPSNGQPSFLAWIFAVGCVGALGYVKQLKPVANALLFLIIIVLLLHNTNRSGTGGFFVTLSKALEGK